MTDWYYVEGRDRVGPVDQEKILSMIQDNTLNGESFLWRKGFDDWKKLNEIPELMDLLNQESHDQPEAPASEEDDDLPPFITEGIDWDEVNENDAIFTIKIGLDRGGEESEYGPYSLNQLKKAFEQNRINEKTYVFATGMENWMFIGDIPVYEKFFHNLPPAINEEERRKHTRKPFVARMFFHDNSELYEGVCRDVSIGGLQILISGFPAHVGETVMMNVHPDNSEFSFVAKGKIVRILDGNQGFSLRFLELNEEAVSAINQYIQEF